ncbi:MAG: S-layer homology domain-containing protein [Oscillospiraceae bacterium]|nr:S-layer homology domain-containing protein [Oscillospiraceae bacterium]
MKQRLCAILLTAALLLSVLPAQAAAVTGTALTEPPAEGDTVVIYNVSYQVAMAYTASENGYTIPSVSAAGGTLGNGALIFTVHTDGTYYTFENRGRYLCTKDNEDLFFNDTQTAYTKWTLTRQGSGWLIENATAVYSGTGKNVCLEYYAPSFTGWTYNGGSTVMYSMGFYRVTDPLNYGFVVSPSAAIAAPDAYVGTDYTFTVQLQDYTNITSLYATYAFDGGAAKQVSYASHYGTAYAFTIPAAELAGHSTISLHAQMVNESGISYQASAAATVRDEPLIGQTLPAYSTAVDTSARPEIAAELINCGVNPTLQMTLDGAAVAATLDGGWATCTPGYALNDGAHTVKLRVTRADGKTAEKSWEFYVGDRPVKAYFGQLHSHTEYSDGAGSLAEAYQYAMTAKDVDYLIVTDHSNYFDSSSTATVSSYYNLSSLEKSGSLTKWEQARATAAEYNAKSADFVAAYGYEMTWSAGPGHTNTFNTYGVVSRNNRQLNDKLGYAGMHLYNDLMVNADRGLDENGKPVSRTKYIENAPVVSQLNHPGVTFGTFDEYAGYNEDRDEIICLIEVGNGSGSVLNSGYWRSYSEYDKCLAMGWHVAPTNNQDNHGRRWGDSNTHRSVIVTNDFTEAGLYRAMSQRRVYATEDQNLTIYYYLNGALMGDVIQTNDQQIHITADISDPDGERISTVSVIGENGLTVQTSTVTGSSCKLDVTIDNTQQYYYLKIVEADGDIAVTAPVWVEPDESGVCRHEWDGGVVTKQATCTEGGERVYTCLRCGETKTELLPPTGHQEVFLESKPATCTESGLTGSSYCAVCGAVLQEQTVIPALGHLTVTDPAVTQTCTQDGKTEGSHCARCGLVFVAQVITPATGHDYREETVKATCTTPGYTEYTCANCGDSYRQNFTPLADHVWSAGTVTVVPTQHSTGKVTYTCTVCGTLRTEILPALQSDEPCDGGKNCPSRNFWDVRVNDWYHEAVDFAVEKGLFNGMTDTTFAPNTTMTRAMLVTVLWRYEGEPRDTENTAGAVSGDNETVFTDVPRGEWYTAAVTWAAKESIVSGVGNGKFDPNGKITREQLAAILYRYADYKGYRTDSYDNMSDFLDRYRVSFWAQDACGWAVAEKLITGIGDRLEPQGSATRAQVATILMRFIRNIAE